MHQLLIDLARGLKYFNDVELTHGGDEDKFSLKCMKLIKKKHNGRPKNFTKKNVLERDGGVCRRHCTAINAWGRPNIKRLSGPKAR